MNSVIIVRGYPGSGRTTLASELAQNGKILSIENYYDDVPSGQDVFASLKIAYATADLLRDFNVALQQKTPLVVVDVPALRLWELRDLIRLAERRGYTVEITEPTTAWAKDPGECAARTHFPLKETTWKWVVRTWETFPNREAIMSSYSPDERHRQARYLVSMEGGVSGVAAAEVQRFVLDNYPEETAEMVQTGFWGDDASSHHWERFRNQMREEGRRPPDLVPLPAPEIGTALDKLRQSLSDKPNPALPDVD